MSTKVCIQKKHITSSRIGEKSKKLVYFLQPVKRVRLAIEQYIPFSNLALCPKSIIAFVQNPQFEPTELEATLMNLKMPAPNKKHETLIKMRKIVEKQETFASQFRLDQETGSEISDQSQLSSQQGSDSTKLNNRLMNSQVNNLIYSELNNNLVSDLEQKNIYLPWSFDKKNELENEKYIITDDNNIRKDFDENPSSPNPYFKKNRNSNYLDELQDYLNF